MIEREDFVNDRSTRITISIPLPRFRTLGITYHRPFSRRQQVHYDRLHAEHMADVHATLDRHHPGWRDA